MAILAAFNSPEVEVVGLTSLFGNVRTPMATANAVFLRELADRHDVRAFKYKSTSTAGQEFIELDVTVRMAQYAVG